MTLILFVVKYLISTFSFLPRPPAISSAEWRFCSVQSVYRVAAYRRPERPTASSPGQRPGLLTRFDYYALKGQKQLTTNNGTNVLAFKGVGTCADGSRNQCVVREDGTITSLCKGENTSMVIYKEIEL